MKKKFFLMVKKRSQRRVDGDGCQANSGQSHRSFQGMVLVLMPYASCQCIECYLFFKQFLGGPDPIDQWFQADLVEFNQRMALHHQEIQLTAKLTVAVQTSFDNWRVGGTQLLTPEYGDDRHSTGIINDFQWGI